MPQAHAPFIQAIWVTGRVIKKKIKIHHLSAPESYWTNSTIQIPASCLYDLGLGEMALQQESSCSWAHLFSSDTVLTVLPVSSSRSLPHFKALQSFPKCLLPGLKFCRPVSSWIKFPFCEHLSECCCILSSSCLYGEVFRVIPCFPCCMHLPEFLEENLMKR